MNQADPDRWVEVVEPGEDWPGWVTISRPDLPWIVGMRVDTDERTHDLHELRLTQRSGEPVPITASRLRALPIWELHRLAIAAASGNHLLTQEGLRPERYRKGQTWTPDHFRSIALMYEAAVSGGTAPRPAIADAWGVTLATASSWIRKARDLGFLGYPERRGIAGSTAAESPAREDHSRRNT